MTPGNKPRSKQIELRDGYLRTLAHVEDAFEKCAAMSGPKGSLSAPDLHKLSEGLYLSAWTHWEQFCRDLFIVDLAEDPKGALRSEIGKFRTKGAPRRLALRLVDHPDENRFVEWNHYPAVQERANDMLGSDHRFVQLKGAKSLEHLKRIRNAIAHRSDHAWASFMALVKDKHAPFMLTASQCRGLTPGRFLSSHEWANKKVIVTAIDVLSKSARELVTDT